MSILKQTRQNLGLTQDQFAEAVGMSLKTVKNWEQGIRQPKEWIMDLVIDYIMELEYSKKTRIDEKSGILPFKILKKRVVEVAVKRNIDAVYLFGSYAKGNATGSSDIDLYIKSSLTGLDFFEIAEILRQSLGKKVGLLSNKTVGNDSEILHEIMRTGILLYER